MLRKEYLQMVVQMNDSSLANHTNNTFQSYTFIQMI